MVAYAVSTKVCTEEIMVRSDCRHSKTIGRKLSHAMGPLHAISPTPSPALLRGSRGLQVLCVIMPEGTDMNTDSDSSYWDAWRKKTHKRYHISFELTGTGCEAGLWTCSLWIY